MWYVVQTLSGKEYAAIEKCKNALDRQFAARIFTPTCQIKKKFKGQWEVKELIAFPGYIFIESDMPGELEESLKHIATIVTPVRIGGGFYPVRKEEEDTLRRLMDGNDCICISVGHIVDQKLIIERGPLNGFTESVKWIDRHKRLAELEVQLFDEKRKIRVGLEVISKTA